MSASHCIAEAHSAFELLDKEVQGVVELHVLLPSDLPRLFAKRAQGDTQAAALLSIVGHAVELIQSSPPEGQAPCGVCRTPIGNRDFALVIAHAGDLKGRNQLGFVVCSGCAKTTAEVRELAIKSLREVWPNVRPIVVGDAVGHACRAVQRIDGVIMASM